MRKAAEIPQRVRRRAISSFSLSSDVFCMRLQKDISEETLNKWDKHLSSEHMLMPILMKDPMNEKKGGWYHRRQRKTSGYTLRMMQRQPCLVFKELLSCEPAARDMFASAQTAVSPISSKFTSVTRWCHENAHCVLCFFLNIVQLHYLVLLVFFCFCFFLQRCLCSTSFLC